jgi:glucose 1-dehydrogenase
MIREKLNLTGRTALITGSSQGIGEGIAIALAESGAEIVLQYRSGKHEAARVAKKIMSLGGKAHMIRADLSKRGAPSRLFQQALALVKQIDILVINASVQLPDDWLKVSAGDFDTQVTTNFKSTFQLMQLFAPAMVQRKWGRILTVGSVQQEKPHPAMIVYAATKSAVLNLVRNVAMQLAENGVTVNNLAPGVIDTPRIKEKVPKMDERIEHRMETPIGRIGKPEDCAAMAMLLCSDAGNFITGQNIFVDGGMSL